MDVEKLIADIGVWKTGQKAEILRRLQDGLWIPKKVLMDRHSSKRSIDVQINKLRELLARKNYKIHRQSAYRLEGPQ